MSPFPPRELLYGPSFDPVYNGVPDYNLPVGAMDTPLKSAHPDRIISIDAQKFDWPKQSHGAAFYESDKPEGLFSDPYDCSLPRMWGWYQEIFKTNGSIGLGNNLQ